MPKDRQSETPSAAQPGAARVEKTNGSFVVVR